MSALAVVNPRSAAGRTGRDWPRLETALREIFPTLHSVTTRTGGNATELVRAGLHAGIREIIAIGGDGTINEAVNGFFEHDNAIAPDAVFSFITSGTGGDFRKSFGISAGPSAAIAHLKHAIIRPIDIGRVTCASAEGGTTVRHFINIASAGMSGEIVERVNRSLVLRRLGGRVAFALSTAATLVTYRGRKVHLRIDSEIDTMATISTLVVANGQFFGGGMHIAPHAELDDGLFDVVVMEAVSGRQALADMGQIYNGTHLDNSSVRALRATKVLAAPLPEAHEGSIRIEVDGEVAGQLPATFEILPNALMVRA
jgi:YegS/Rv2252/BmrU family lipid kinase